MSLKPLVLTALASLTLLVACGDDDIGRIEGRWTGTRKIFGEQLLPTHTFRRGEVQIGSTVVKAVFENRGGDEIVMSPTGSAGAMPAVIIKMIDKDTITFGDITLRRTSLSDEQLRSEFEVRQAAARKAAIDAFKKAAARQ
jgi:hypothetical protein